MEGGFEHRWKVGGELREDEADLGRGTEGHREETDRQMEEGGGQKYIRISLFVSCWFPS